MIGPGASEGYQSGQALLERVRATGPADHLAVDLAAALGIVLAETAGDDGNGLLLLALADIVMRATFSMRQAKAAIADCRGSA